MQVTFLGTGQLHPADRAQAGILIENGPLLVDCGAGVYQRACEAGVDFDSLSHILFTHLHNDHVSDLIPIVNAKRYADDRPLPDAPGRTGTSEQFSLTITGPVGTRERVSHLLRPILKGEDFPVTAGRVEIDVDEVEPDAECRIAGIDIETRVAEHNDYQALAYKFDDQLVISGDTTPLDTIGEFAEEAGVLIHECTFFYERPTAGHTTPAGLAEMLAGRDIDEVYLNHLPAHTPQERRAVLQTLRQDFDGNVVLASDLDRFSTVS